MDCSSATETSAWELGPKPYSDIAFHKMMIEEEDYTNFYCVTRWPTQIIAVKRRACLSQGRRKEIFIRQLPPDTLLHEIFELAHPFGEVLQIRLLLNRKGYCKGSAFVRFVTQVVTSRAVAELNGTNFRDTVLLVKLGFEKNRLLLTNVPLHLGPTDLRSRLSSQMRWGLTDVIGTAVPGRFVLKYSTRKMAQGARNSVPHGFMMDDQWVSIYWCNEQIDEDAPFADGNHDPVAPYPSKLGVWFMPPNANIPEMPVILHIVVPSPNSAIQLMGDPFRFNQLFSRSVLRYPSGIHCIYSYLEFFTPGNGPLNGTGPGTIVSIGRVVYVINQCSVCQNHNGQ